MAWFRIFQNNRGASAEEITSMNNEEDKNAPENSHDPMAPQTPDGMSAPSADEPCSVEESSPQVHAQDDNPSQHDPANWIPDASVIASPPLSDESPNQNPDGAPPEQVTEQVTDSGAGSAEKEPSLEHTEESYDNSPPEAQEEVKSDSEKNPKQPGFAINFALPNAKDGEPYQIEQFKEKLFGPQAEDVTHYYIEGLDDSGVSLLEDEDTLSGTPTLIENEAKNLKLKLFYHLASKPRSKPYSHDLRFIINPDPKKLWKNNPSNREVPYWKLDEECDLIQEESGRLIAASKRGRSHAHDGTCRDDHYAIKYFHKTGWWLSVVSDGAGSAQFSRKGAEIACTSGVRFFEEFMHLLESEDMQSSISEYCENDARPEGAIPMNLQKLFIKQVGYPSFLEIFEHAKKSSHKPKDYNTTFLISAWKKMKDGWFVCGFAIGDGGIAVHESHGPTALSKGDEGEFSGETVFLTSNNVWEDSSALIERVKFGFFQNVRAIYAMSDGISDPKFETEHNFTDPDRWEALASEIDECLADSESPHESLLQWMDFWSPGNHDDRTLTVFHPTPELIPE